MKQQSNIGKAIGEHSWLWAATWLAVLAAAFIAGGCSSEVSTGHQASGDGATSSGTDRENASPDTASASDTAPPVSSEASPDGASAQLPRLLDLGAGKCIPCKMMAPILDELAEQYEGVIEVQFIDVWQMPDEAKKYGVSTIPTQIFFDASGEERFRHEGFFAKEEILAKWRELGVDLQE